MKPRNDNHMKYKRVFVLNIYALRKMYTYVKKYMNNSLAIPYRNALIACDDLTTLSVIKFRSTIFSMCRVDLGYGLGFNKAKFSFNTKEEYNNVNQNLKKSIETQILSLTSNMTDYIRLRGHVSIENIVKFTNEAEQNNNIEQFLVYYNGLKQNQKTNINSSIRYSDVAMNSKIFDIGIKSFTLDNLPTISPDKPFVDNLFISVLSGLLEDSDKLNRSTTESVANFIQQIPIYNNYENFINDYKLARLENFSNPDEEHTKKITQYFRDLAWKLSIGLYVMNNESTKLDPGNAWLVDLLENNKNLVVETQILRRLISKYTKEKQVIRTSINPNFYSALDNDSNIFEIFKQLYILINYGNDIYGLHKANGNN